MTTAKTRILFGPTAPQAERPFVTRMLAPAGIAKIERVAVPASPPDYTGRTLSRGRQPLYTLVEKVGEGAIGAVYRGVSLKAGEQGKDVAIKVLLSDGPEEFRLRERVEREAFFLQYANHPNILKCYDVIDNGALFIVLEFLRGKDMETRLGELRAAGSLLGAQRTLALSFFMLDALAYMHDPTRSVVHRDLKPGNVFITQSPGSTLKLIDFGMARFSGADEPHQYTQLGIALGTPQYMPAEQFAGAPALPTMDLYAMGVMLYQMLTGTVPFTSAAADARTCVRELAVHHMRTVPVRPNDRLAADGRLALSDALESIVLTLLAKTPSARFQSAEATANALAHTPEGGELASRLRSNLTNIFP